MAAPPPLNIATQYARLILDGLRDALGHAAARARDLGFDAGSDFAVGRIAAQILEGSERHRPTLIAMSTHGRSGPSRWALGSTTEKVLRASTVPLLVCR
jgi:nucleotide-binding universal stress UspA family protein